MTFHDSFGYFECVANGRCGLTWSILGQRLPWMAVHSNESIPGVGNPAERHLQREPARQLRHIRSLTAPPPIYNTSFLPFIGHFHPSWNDRPYCTENLADLHSSSLSRWPYRHSTRFRRFLYFQKQRKPAWGRAHESKQVKYYPFYLIFLLYLFYFLF